MPMPSVMSHNFSQVPQADIPRSAFDRSHGIKTTFNAGELVPIFVDEALPGDTFTMSMAGFGRLATPLHPFMDNLFLNTFFFAVPLRLIWNNWKRFNGEQSDPGDSTDFLCPQVTCPPGGFSNQSLYDYFGVPTNTDMEPINNFAGRAYNLIWNDWFRDENLQDMVRVDKDDGPDDPQSYKVLRRGKRHDYFTSCLPWPQKGPGVDIPLGSVAPVVPKGNGVFTLQNGQNEAFSLTPTDGTRVINKSGDPGIGTFNLGWDNPQLEADLSEATAATINQLRQAFQIQKLYERDARGGTRYTEVIKAHFGVTSPDARLQRPEYLGGGQAIVNLNPVAQSSGTAVEDGYTPTPQGNLAAYGTVAYNGHGFSKSFTEHSIVIGMVCARADLNYQQGLNRMWTRQSRFDFYWPALANIGEQAVLQKEIYVDGSASDQDVFGYQERFAEYRYKPSVITGKFRSNDPQSLDTWHLAQDFETRPVLDAVFIEEDPPIDRVIAVLDEPHFLLDGYFRYRCARPMPTYSVPGLIDHF